MRQKLIGFAFALAIVAGMLAAQVLTFNDSTPKPDTLTMNKPTCTLILPDSIGQVTTLWLTQSDEHGYDLHFVKNNVVPVTGGIASVALIVD